MCVCIDFWALGAEVRTQASSRLELFASARFGRNEYDNPITLPGFSETRRDDSWRAVAGASYRLGRGMDLTVAYSRNQADSTIPLYSYDQNAVSVSFQLTGPR